MRKVSVLVPAYNCESTIKRSIESIMRQTYQDIEVIILNDGSTDNTAIELEKLKMKYPAIKIIHRQNLGVSATRNDLIKKASGDWIFFVDSDDTLQHAAIENLWKYANVFGSELVVGSHRVIGNSFRYTVGVKKTKVVNSRDACRMLLQDKQIKNYVWGKLIKKNLFDKLEFKEGFVFEDVDLMAKIFANAQKIVFTDEIVYNYYVNRKDSISHGLKPSIMMDMIDAYENQVSFIQNRFGSLNKESNFALRRLYMFVIALSIVKFDFNSQAYHYAKFKLKGYYGFASTKGEIFRNS